MSGQTVTVRVAEPLRFLLPVRHRHGEVVVALDPEATAGHLVESLGVPHTEFGALIVNGRPGSASARLAPGDVVEVLAAPRPQPVPYQRFLLDVHLGSLARRMRLLGLDTAYRNDADDDELAQQAAAEGRVLLTQDRGLLRRRAVVAGGYVRGSRVADQLADVLERFAPNCARGPAVRRVTVTSSRSTSTRSSTCWRRAPAARTRSSRAAVSAPGRTGAAPTPPTSSRSWTPPPGSYAAAMQRVVVAPTAADLARASEIVRRHLRPTPVVAGPDVVLKLECLQPTGSFKVRGALVALEDLAGPARAAGVVTASAGNHGLGVAYAAGVLGIAATIVVPTTASPSKVAALRDFPVTLVEHGDDYAAAERHALAIAATGPTYVSAYNDAPVIAGNGSVAAEIREQVEGPLTIVVPVGGGGLVSGVGLWAADHPDVRVVGVEAEASTAVSAAVSAGRVVEVAIGATLADGLAGNLEPGSVTPALVAAHTHALVSGDRAGDPARDARAGEATRVGGRGLRSGRCGGAAGPQGRCGRPAGRHRHRAQHHPLLAGRGAGRSRSNVRTC
jgi:threonine dehydratase